MLVIDQTCQELRKNVTKIKKTFVQLLSLDLADTVPESQ